MCTKAAGSKDVEALVYSTSSSSLCATEEGKHAKRMASVVFKGPVLGLTKDWDWTETGPTKTKTEKDQSLVFFSLNLGLEALGMLFRLPKDQSQPVFSVDHFGKHCNNLLQVSTD